MKKKRFSSLTDTSAMVVLLFCLTIVAVGCILGISYLVEYGFYTDGDYGQTAKSVAVQIYSIDDAEMAKDFHNCRAEGNHNNPRLKWYKEKFSPQNSNFVFLITDKNGSFRGSSTEGTGYSFESIKEKSEYTGKIPFYSLDDNGNPDMFLLNYAVVSEEDMVANDKYSQAFRWIDIANSLKYFIFFVLFVSILIIIILLSIITINAGSIDEETGEIVPGAVEKIPLDVLTLCLISLFALAWVIISLTSAADVDMVLNNFVVMITCVVAVFVIMTYLSTLSVRVKMGKFYKNSVIYMAYRKFKRKTPRKIRRKFSEISVFRKLIIGIICFFLMEAVILIGISYLGILKPDPVRPDNILLTFIIVWGITRLVIIPIFAMIAINLYYVKEEGERIAEGIMGDSVADKLSISSIRAHGKNLDLIKKEINRAMEQELKSEKLKSELITNVSHDLKTPLTSIKNYVDFLQRDDITEEQRREYTKTIAKHTDKLSMLLSNLLEASQISSGNVEVNLEKTSLNIMLQQSLEEFSIKFMQSDLLPRIDMPEDDIYVMGDGQWLWRIFSNLLNNACKYAAPDTDIEITLKKENGKASVEFSNISNAELNVEGDELFERFVRGDSSRHTEGNGLGLSIAKSLVELQGGAMNIAVLGDKFSAIIIFDSID